MDEPQSTPTLPTGDDIRPAGNSGQVMDIQVKSDGDDTTASGPSVATDNSDPSTVTSDPMVDEMADSPVTQPPVAGGEEPVAPVTAVPLQGDGAQNAQPANPGESSLKSDDKPVSDSPLAITKPAADTHKAPVLAILVAVIVAALLAGLVVFKFLKDRKQSSSTTQTSASQAVAPKPQASISDVDTTSQQIDTNLKKTDDSKDFQTNDLSDTSLGL